MKKVYQVKENKTSKQFELIIPFKKDGYYAHEIEAIINKFLAMIGFSTRVINFMGEIYKDDYAPITDEVVDYSYHEKYGNKYIKIVATKEVSEYDIIHIYDTIQFDNINK